MDLIGQQSRNSFIHLWDIPETETETTQDESIQHGVDFLQDDNSSKFVLTDDLGELQLLTHHRNDMAPEVVPDHMITSSHQPATDDDFINDVIDEDETLEDYVDEELGEDDSETDKESSSDDHLEYYSETNND